MHCGDLDLALSADHLVELGEALLALVALELTSRPLIQPLFNYLHRLCIVLWQPHLLPHLLRQVRSLYRLEVEEAVALVLENCRVPTVR